MQISPLPQMEIIIPNLDNEGDDATAAHSIFVAYLAARFDGFTAYQVAGQWLSDDERMFADHSTCYRVAGRGLEFYPQSVGEAVVQVLKVARAVFPDQLAFYISNGPQSVIVARGDIPPVSE